MMHEKGVPFERRYIDLKANPDDSYWLSSAYSDGDASLLDVNAQVVGEHNCGKILVCAD
jgi:hypothetical protein